MRVIHKISPIRNYLSEMHQQSKKIGLVPTMGALHDGHMQLIRQALIENDIVICSIYVNPAQFNNTEDLKNYPVTLEKDLELLTDLGCHCAFCPDNHIMYPVKTLLATDMGYLDQIMEGKYRPGHFNGVRIIIAKLFNIISPDNAYFGKKDFQQLAVIRKLTSELAFDVKIRPIETVRESDGLAKSSRNMLLTEQSRKDATIIHEALLAAQKQLINGVSPIKVKQMVQNMFVDNGNVGKLEYFEIVDKDTLIEIHQIDDSEQVQLCIAGYFLNIRLIDNISLI